MATREEVKSALAKRLNKYKVQTPTRIAYLGDGRGQATSNIVPPGEPDKFWARESLNGEKPFKVLNRNPNFTPAFNLPILLGYPEDDPDTEQVMGIHRGLVQFSTGNAGSAIGGVAPHHIKHEWGGGDEVFVDPRMFKPGLVKPTAPASMFVKILSFEHYYNEWRRYEGGTSPDLTQYKPSSDYRYVLLCLDPDTNQLTVRSGAVFTPDLSIDSIISNQAQNTFRHIPVPPGNEIPLGVVLLEPSTTKIDWNINGVNNLLPMRLLLSAPMKEINERISALESATGISSLPATGAANSVQTDLLPARIDGNITRMVLNRSSSSSTLPVLFVGELGFVNNSPSQIWVGTASGNHLFNPGGGGGATTLGDLTDVTISVINDQYLLKYDSATSMWIGASSIKIGNNPSGIYFDHPTSLIGITAPLLVTDQDGAQLIQTGVGVRLDSVADGYPIRFQTPNGAALYVGGVNGDTNELVINPNSGGARMSGLDDNGNTLFEFDPNYGFRFATADSSSAIDINYAGNEILFNQTTRLKLQDHASAVVVDRPSSSVLFAPDTVRFNASTTRFSGGSLIVDPASFRVITGVAPSALQINQDGRVYFGREEISSATPFYIDYLLGKTGFGAHDFIIATSSNSSAFVVDKDLGAVQIGTSVAGQVADFRSHLIQFNKNQNDINVRISGAGVQNGYFYDAGTNRHGFGNDTPLFPIHSIYDGGNNSAFETYSDTAAVGAVHILRKGRGSYVLPGTVQNGDTLGGFAFGGYQSGFHNPILITGTVTENWTGTAHGAKISFATTVNGTTTRTEKMSLQNGLQIGSPTGGDKGAGTINCAADIYKNNVAYTSPDYSLEHWVTGKIEKFKNNDGADGYFRLSIEESKEYVKKNMRLPRITDEPAGIFGMANIALEKIEEAHIYIYELHDRIKELEARLAKLEKNNE